jgi:hypothetical protein
MTARQYIELIQKALSSILTLDDVDLHEEYVRLFVGRAYNQIVCDLVSKGFKDLDLFCKLYKGISIEQDTDTEIYYSLLPVDISPLPNVKSGVRSVGPTNSPIDYVPLSREKLSIYSQLSVSTVSSRIGYTVGKNDSGKLTVDYFGMSVGNEPTSVKMYLLIPFEAYKDTDIINIPAGQDQNILNLVVKFMREEPVKDLKTSDSKIKY